MFRITSLQIEQPVFKFVALHGLINYFTASIENRIESPAVIHFKKTFADIKKIKCFKIFAGKK